MFVLSCMCLFNSRCIALSVASRTTSLWSGGLVLAQCNCCPRMGGSTLQPSFVLTEEGLPVPRWQRTCRGTGPLARRCPLALLIGKNDMHISHHLLQDKINILDWLLHREHYNKLPQQIDCRLCCFFLCFHFLIVLAAIWQSEWTIAMGQPDARSS